MAVIADIACYGDSVGAAIVYASGGILNNSFPDYSYLWDNGETDTIAYALTSGSHSVLLSDAWGCEVSQSVIILENPEIVSSIYDVINVSCYGGADGSASITSVGGVAGYIYFWSNDPIGHINMPDIVTGLLHGSYYVTTQDVLGCEVLDSIYISEPEPLSMEASELDWIDCLGYNNGLAYATALGGTAPYTFVWDNGQWTGDTINTLTPGLHTVVVTDFRGCSATDTVFTHEPTKLIIEIDSTQTVLAYCIGVSTASLTGVASGGTPGYSYEWDDNITTPQTTATASSLLAGVYTVTATDIKGCIASYTIDIDTITNTMDAGLTSLVQYIGGNDVSCFGEDDAEAMVTAWGAYAPYLYQWYGPNSFNSNDASIADLVAGTYSVIVTDTNNCTVNRSIVLTEPNYIYFTTLSATDESCLGACNGQMQIDISGGVAPYTGIATENTTGNMITSLMANDSIVPGMCSGTYILTITDTNNCPSSVINGGVNQQTIGTSVFTATTIDPATITNVDCYGMATGVLQALNPNTAPGYSYSWENANNPGISISNTTQAINLIAGTYVLYAYYADTTSGQNYEGCTTTDMASITQLAALQANASITNVDCYGNATGSITLNPTGGEAPYLFSWDTTISLPGGSSLQDQYSLQPGTYILTITDTTNNCQVADTFEVAQPPVLDVSVSQGGYTLTATPTGGTAPFFYSWRNSSNTHLQSGATYTVIDYGSYYVIVTDSNGCEVTSSPPITFTFTASWDCIAQACVDPGNGNGVYSSLSACNTSCISTELEEFSVFEISIYPNPFREETTVDFGMEIKEAVISVVDIFGKQIESYLISNTNQHILKRNNKASGIYFVEIEVGTVKLFTKIIIE
jgi:hypothetical protein